MTRGAEGIHIDAARRLGGGGAVSWGQLAGVLAVAAVAAAGQVILSTASVTADIRGGLSQSAARERSDMDALLGAAHALIQGQPAHPWYGTHFPMSYAPPFTVLTAPLALLSLPMARTLSAILAACLVAVALYTWTASTQRGPAVLMAAVLAVPVLQVVAIGQLESAVGLAALTLAIFAQRRGMWWVVGVGLAVGSLRISNALPVAGMILVGLWGRPRAVLAAAGGAALVLIPLCAVAFWWDPHWPSDYLTTLSYERLYGPIGLVQIVFGNRGAMVATGLQCAFCAFLVRGDRGRPLDLDRAALGMASTVLTAMIAGWYCAVYALPALIRLAGRDDQQHVIWLAAAVPWIAVICSGPWLLGSDPQSALNYHGTLGPVLFAGGAFPLFRRRRSTPSLL